MFHLPIVILYQVTDRILMNFTQKIVHSSMVVSNEKVYNLQHI